ncbi:hypothetical protein HBI47_171550 [Parastagonospora nodorum]|nr:hypothetical protein HBI47_171550 [Parastagonospora nodorum]
MADMEKSFTFLNDNIPQWLQDITELEEKATAMQEDLVKAPVSTSPFAKHTTNSIESLRQGRMAAVLEEAAPLQAARADASGSRKRKTHSVLSGRASGPSRYHRRTMVVMNYDGDMQKSFELLVRAIGTGRNMLRKAKMEAKMNELAALAGSSDDDDDDDVDDEQDETSAAKVSYRPRMASMRARAAARRGGARGASGAVTTPVAVFDTTDKTLEHAQNLCEKAAHVTLRDGDCRKELEGMRKSFADVLETAKTEVTKYPAAQRFDPPELRSNDTSDTFASSIEEPSYKKHFPQLSLPPSDHHQKSMLPSISTATATFSTPKIMDIEADDDDDEDEPDFVMPPTRLTSRFAARA